MTKQFSYNNMHSIHDETLKARCAKFCERNGILIYEDQNPVEAAFNEADYRCCYNPEEGKRLKRSLEMICRRVFGGRGFNGWSTIDGGVVGLWH